MSLRLIIYDSPRKVTICIVHTCELLCICLMYMNDHCGAPPLLHRGPQGKLIPVYTVFSTTHLPFFILYSLSFSDDIISVFIYTGDRLIFPSFIPLSVTFGVGRGTHLGMLIQTYSDPNQEWSLTMSGVAGLTPLEPLPPPLVTRAQPTTLLTTFLP